MAKKPYDWIGGAELEDHSVRKHRVLREYFAQYLEVRCSLPAQEKFRLAIVDGFAGGGRYEGGEAGSPIIFLEELVKASRSLNLRRAADAMKPIRIECLLVLNDSDPRAIAELRSNVAPLLIEAEGVREWLEVRVDYRQLRFEQAMPEIEQLLKDHSFRNILVNLDQCGTSFVDRSTITRIMSLSNSVEVFYTFMISSLLAFLNKTDRAALRAQLRHLDLSESDLAEFEKPMANSAWMGKAEQIVFNAFHQCAPFHSPFSINNPEGWRYWLIHFSRQYRAREVYNRVLHENATMQAHFGRSGLNMLTYDPRDEGALYLFDADDRARAVEQLAEDIPRLVSAAGDAVLIGEFYDSIFNLTPARADDIRAAMFASPDLEVRKEDGGVRRSANRVTVSDHLRFKPQSSFYPLFNDPLKKS